MDIFVEKGRENMILSLSRCRLSRESLYVTSKKDKHFHFNHYPFYCNCRFHYDYCQYNLNWFYYVQYSSFQNQTPSLEEIVMITEDKGMRPTEVISCIPFHSPCCFPFYQCRYGCNENDIAIIFIVVSKHKL